MKDLLTAKDLGRASIKLRGCGVLKILLERKKQWAYKRQEKGKVFWITPTQYKRLKRYFRETFDDCSGLNFAEPRLVKLFGHEIRLKYPLLTGG